MSLPPCRPPWWARGGHGQTVWGHVLPCRAPIVDDARHELELEDGDRLVLFSRDVADSAAVVYLFHGLGGDSESDYIRRTAAALPGCSVVAFNHRGCGAGRGLARGPYHSGSTADLAAAIDWGRARRPDARHVAIGFSLSGNTLLLMMARGGGPDAAIAVNPPINLAASADAISSGFNRVYDLRFVQRLVRDPRSRGAGLRPWHTIRDVDELYTAPAAGFADAGDYYARCSSGPHLGSIERPVVILTAADDPFVPVASFDAVPDNVHLHVEPVGGHMGYLDREGHWLDGALAAYVTALA